MKNDYDAIIIGSGIGGLLSGAILSKKGYKPLILEKLSFCGGKFTSFNYMGFEVPTGAFHALPGGYHGNIGKLIKYLNLNIEIIEASPSFIAAIDDKDYIVPIDPKDYKYIFSKDSFFRALSLREKIELVHLLYVVMYSKFEIPDVSLDKFVKKYTKSPKLLKLIDRIVAFTNSASIEESSAIDIVSSIRLQEKNFEGVIRGGCKSLISELIQFIEENGGTILRESRVNKILVENEKAIGVATEKNSYFSNLIISNAGPRQTINLLGGNCPEWLLKKEARSIPVSGITYSISSNKPLLKYRSVYLPFDAEKICGYLQITNFDPTLSPRDEHYILAYQFIERDENINDAIKSGKHELLKLFPQISDDSFFNINVYRDDWPAAFTQQRSGQTGNQRYPIRLKGIENLYMIGHDSEGYGFAAEIIGYAVLKLNEMI